MEMSLFDFLADAKKISMRVDQRKLAHAPRLELDGVQIGDLRRLEVGIQLVDRRNSKIAAEEAFLRIEMPHQEEMQFMRFPRQDGVVILVTGPDREAEFRIKGDGLIEIE